ncbi:MAG: ADP-ribosylglycohydrolase family protein [Planctomycetes bacterium]|nr:ADP-ribosylglycohydrolase family protein [Planctomycetota bacterium]
MSETHFLWLGVVALAAAGTGARGAQVRSISRAELLDRIRGGWAGQMIGNVQGLPFEFKYKDEPGPLPDFMPNLPRCRSDDDTDIEWAHLHAMDRLGVLLVPYPDLAREWVRSVNRGIWVSNELARRLIGQGIIPPWTSHFAVNTHAKYNLSGQFCVEAFGLLAPGLPTEAARIGAHYARVSVRGEPLQATAFTTALISLAFFERDVPRLITLSLASVDPKSQHAEMVRDVLAWHAQSPADWHLTRAAIQKKYRDERGWNMNATVTNGAIVIAALLYGKGDFVETLRLCFAMGYDADCNGATCGTVLGVILGAKAMAAKPGWVLPAHYDNNTRDGLPKSESLDDLVALTARLAEKAVLAAGGRREGEGDAATYTIPAQEPALFERLEDGLPKGGIEEVDEAIDQEALKRLDDASPAARSFAAIRLANHRRGRLAPADKSKVAAILEETLKDDVLAPLAKAALASLVKP